jgi:fructose-1,6-bisphosphatase
MISEAERKAKRTYAKSQKGKAAQKRFAQSPKGKAHRRRNHLKFYYNLTIDQFNDLMSKQEGKCAICNIMMVRLSVDHDHVTGKVRGLLCPTCNRAIGMFKDNPLIMRSAANYIEREI